MPVGLRYLNSKKKPSVLLIPYETERPKYLRTASNLGKRLKLNNLPTGTGPNTNEAGPEKTVGSLSWPLCFSIHHKYSVEGPSSFKYARPTTEGIADLAVVNQSAEPIEVSLELLNWRMARSTVDSSAKIK